MGIGTGLGAQFGVAKETTYGTYVAPDHFLEIDKEDLKLIKTTVQGGGLAAGRFVDLGSRRVLTTTSGGGTVDMEVANSKFGILLAHLMGSTATPVQQAATTAYLQTHNLGDNTGLYLTAQAGIPSTNGTVNPYSFTGGKVLSASFSCEVTGILTSTWEFDFKSVTEAQSLATASYPTTISPFHGGQMNVKIGTYGAEASIQGVTKVDFKIERSLATDRFYASGTSPATKAEPLPNGNVKISGTLSTDLVTKADLADRFAADSSASLIIEWVGPIIASTYAYTFRLRVPQFFIDTDTPNVDGPDIVNTSYAFTGQYDGTHPAATLEYMSTDTAV